MTNDLNVSLMVSYLVIFLRNRVFPASASIDAHNHLLYTKSTIREF
jgi:hypothetical protein